MKRIIPLIAATMLLLSACGAKSGMEVRNAWSRPAAQGGNGGVFFELRNHDAAPDELTGASSTVAEAVEIHESKMEGDVMQMRMIPSLPIEANAEITFEPGGLHVMLIGLNHDLETDDEFEVTLHFKIHEDIIVHVVVKGALQGMGDGM